MPWVRRGAIGLLAAVLVIVAVAYLLPGQVTVTRRVEIAAPPAAVFPLVADLRRIPEWSPWFASDPEIEVTFTGPIEGVGQTIEWKSALPNIGSGRQTVTRIEPDAVVEMEVAFGPAGAASAWLGLDGEGATTTVTWGFRTDLASDPLSRYLGLLIDGVVGPDFEAGLGRLKALAEAAPGPG
ncbi:MAG: SRPBCC family protein [Bauldia sp.]